LLNTSCIAISASRYCAHAEERIVASKCLWRKKSLQILQKKVVFLVSRKEMKFHHFFAPLEKPFWLPMEKSTIDPPLEKILPTPMSLEIFARSSG